MNKVETAAEACWLVHASRVFTDEEKQMISHVLANRINKDGVLQIRSSETRSQLENKLIAQQKMEELVSKSLIKPKKRKATRPSKAAVARRLEGKKKESLKKEHRRGNWGE